jgi:acetylornithine deacetylase/succinyl-diaminopimelate desuccinylase-like protein
MADYSAEQCLFHDIYKELVEINTTDSVGDNTQAARAMRARMLGAGYTADEAEVFEPFPRKGNLVARLKGSGKYRPILLLAHIDVVEAKAEDWNTDPFKLEEQDGYFTARGAIDDKAMASAFVSVLVQLKSECYQPNRDIVLALTADEERLDVPSNGAAWLLKNKPELVDAEFGISEGGRGELKDGKPLLQSIEVAEKQYMSVELETTGLGGHSARPGNENAIYELASALIRIGRYQFPVHLTETTRVFFRQSAKLSNGQMAEDMRAIAEDGHNLEAVARISAQPDLVGMLRTTCVATMLTAGHAENALPRRAKATLNCRVLPNEDSEQVEQKLRELAGPKVTLRVTTKSVPAPASPLEHEVLDAAGKLTEQMWPGVPVIPYMSPATTDMRWMRSVGMPMYGISGMFVDPADTGVHGVNEHIGQKQLYEGREFLYRLVKMLTS